MAVSDYAPWSSDRSLSTRSSVERSIEETVGRRVQAPGLVQKLLERPAIRYNALLLAANVAIGAANFLLHPVLKRLLGVSAYGTFALLLALASAPLSSFFQLQSSQVLLILALSFVVAFASQVNLGAVQGLQRFDCFPVLRAIPT